MGLSAFASMAAGAIGKRGVRGLVDLPGSGIRYETPYYKSRDKFSE